MDSLWPLELVRYVADKMVLPKMDRGFGSNVGERFPDVFQINVPRALLSRIEVLGLPQGVLPGDGRGVCAGHHFCLAMVFASTPRLAATGITQADVCKIFKDAGVVIEESSLTNISEFKQGASVRTSTKVKFSTPEQAKEVRYGGSTAALLSSLSLSSSSSSSSSSITALMCKRG